MLEGGEEDAKTQKGSLKTQSEGSGREQSRTHLSGDPEKKGASSRTIANLVKGKDLSRFCTSCGETDAQKLEEHHSDKVNRPNQTITLCANCDLPPLK